MFTGTLLAAGSPHVRRDLYVIELEPGPARIADPHLPGTVEHLLVGKGRIRCGPEGGPVDLGPGDYAAFPGDAAHVYEALAPGAWAVLIMEHH